MLIVGVFSNTRGPTNVVEKSDVDAHGEEHGLVYS
jgi:hypothetical protein